MNNRDTPLYDDSLANAGFRRSGIPRGHDTVTEMLDLAATQWAERPFFDIGGEQICYGDFRDRVDRLAAGLQSQLLGREDTVCVLLAPCVESMLIWFACNRVGAIFVPLNSALKGDFLVHQINDSLAKILVTDTAHRRTVEEVTPSLSRCRRILMLDHDGRDESAWPSFDTLAEASADTASAPVDVKASDTSVILYTSGTTGPSKGCVASHAYVTSIARKTATRVAMTEKDVSYSTLPLFHIFGICAVVLACMSRGAQVILRPRFSVSEFWSDIRKSGATIVNAVGSMIPLIGGAPESEDQRHCFGQIRVALGIPFSPEDIDVWRERFGIEWVGNIGYGLTEASMITEVDPLTDARDAQSGSPVDFDVRILDDDGNETAPGETGEIVARPLRPGIMFDGYWGRPVDTLRVMRDLWLHTGDLGRFNSNGNLIFVDRKKDYMRSGGENVSSYELESVVRTHPAIADVAAYAVPSPLAEDDIKISVVLTDGAQLNEEELYLWCTSKLPRFCVPQHIEIHRDLPRSPTGKVLKYELRAAGVSASTWSRPIGARPPAEV